jgi:cobalt-zinc-cadmium efflux system outer membrane protein
MDNLFRLLLLVSTAGLLLHQGAAGQSLTLSTLEEEAVQHNLPLIAQRFDIATADADLLTARQYPYNPTLAVNGDIFPHPGKLAPGEKNYNASLTMPLELGGKRSARTEVATHGRASVAHAVEDAVRNLLLTVREAYYDALYARASLDLATETLASLDSVASLNSIRLRAKDISESELMRSEVAALQQRIEVQNSQLDYRKALIAVLAATGRPSADSAFSVEGNLSRMPDTLAMSQEDARAFASAHRPDLLQLEEQCDEAESNLQLQQALSVIDVNVGGYYSNQIGQNFTGLSLSVPLPLFSRNQGEIEKARVRVEQAKAQLAAARRQIDLEVEAAYRDFQSRKAIVQQMQDGIITRARAVQRTVEYSYTRGGTSILDFLEAQRTFNETMKSYFSALASMHKSSAALHAAVNRP